MSMSKTIYPLLGTGSTQEPRPDMTEKMLTGRPPDKRAYLKIIFFYFSTKTYVVGTQKNLLNETVLLCTQNTCLD